MATQPKLDVGVDYKEKYGFFFPEDYVFKAKRGLNEEIVKEISYIKGEPEWMTKLRLRSLEIFRKKPMPTWGADLSVVHVTRRAAADSWGRRSSASANPSLRATAS